MEDTLEQKTRVATGIRGVKAVIRDTAFTREYVDRAARRSPLENEEIHV